MHTISVAEADWIVQWVWAKSTSKSEVGKEVPVIVRTLPERSNEVITASEFDIYSKSHPSIAQRPVYPFEVT